MDKIKNKVVVWSIDDFNTLGLMRELGDKEISLFFLIKGNAGFAAKSKFCGEYAETGTIEDGHQYLLEHFVNKESKTIIIISSDEIITYVDQHKEEFEKNFIIPGTSVKGNIEKYIDKNTMTSLAKKIGILCPHSCYVKWDSSIENVEYPCLIKPSHQKPGHYNEFKTKVCKNKASLKRTLRYVRHDSEFILQQYIPQQLNALVYAGRMRDGKTIFAGVLVRDRWADSGSSSHGFLTSEIPEFIDIKKIEEFVNEIDYYGLFSVEYGIVDNKAYFFEINLRNDGTSHYFYQAGANIPLAYVYSCAGLDYSVVPTSVVGKRWFIDEVFDVENVLLRKISKAEWKRDMEEASVYKYYDKKDEIPYILVKKTRIKQILQDFVLKRFRLYIVFILDKIGLRK